MSGLAQPSRKVLLEIAVDSVDRALAAARGGADRIELCRDLPVGGLTPSLATLRSVKQRLTIPVFAMVRPQAGSYVCNEAILAAMLSEIAALKDSGADGLVLGLLTAETAIDVESTRRLVEAAHPMPVTFHRAFDSAPDLQMALEKIVSTGATRVLTAGGQASAMQGSETIRKLQEQAAGRITVLPGGGLSAENIAAFHRMTHAKELHSGLGSKIAYNSSDTATFESAVRSCVAALASR